MLSDTEQLLYVYCKAREQQSDFSINKGKDNVVIQNIKTFFEENPSGQMWMDGVDMNGVKYSQSENVNFSDIDWEFILSLENKNDILNEMNLHCYDWGCYSLEVMENGKLFVDLLCLNDNAAYYIDEELQSGAITEEDVRKCIEKDLKKYEPFCFSDYSQKDSDEEMEMLL